MRYTITVEMPDDAKARLRSALRLMGALSVRICEAKDEAAAKPIKSDLVPTSAEALAIGEIFKRPATHEWRAEEKAAFQEAHKRGVMTLENIKLVADFYRKKREGLFYRTSILTLVRHFDEELDKARTQAAKKASIGPGFLPTERKIIELPPLEPEQTFTREEIEAEKRRLNTL